MENFLLQRSFHSIFAKDLDKMERVKEENSKDNVRELILQTALEQFTKNGIKDVKMDNIASLLSISKRTIYELFNDKEQLLLEALRLHNDKMCEEGRFIIRNGAHTLEIILNLYDKYVETLSNINKKFFSEIRKYPELYKSKKHDEAKRSKQFLAWMEMGRKQGLFREDANFEIFSFILRRNLDTIFKSNMSSEENELAKYRPRELGRSLIIFYLRGISTPKGQEIIETYLKENEKQ